MKRLSILLPVAAALFFCVTLSAQEKENEFSIDAQLRNRAELRNGVLNPTATNLNNTGFINERVRLGINYSDSWLTMRVAGQHTGVWGQTSQNPVNTGDFNLSEAWAQLNFGKSVQWYFKLGRQGLVYDDERLLGGLDWHVAGRYHDLAKFGFASGNKKHQFEFSAAFNQNTPKVAGGSYFTTGGQPYKTMQNAWYHFDAKSKSPFAFSLLFMNLGFENGTESSPSQRFMQTFGTYVTYKPGIFAFDASFYYQTGKTAKDAAIGAWMFALKANAKFSTVFNATAGLDWLSGEREGSCYTSFDPLYGTHHKFYGIIDYWYINRSKTELDYGLIDPYVSLAVNPVKTLNISLTSHFFLNESNGGIAAIKARQYKANEIDLQLTWNIKKSLTLMGGYSGFFGSKNFYSEYDVINTKITNPNNKQNWFWLQVNINPKIFSTR